MAVQAFKKFQYSGHTGPVYSICAGSDAGTVFSCGSDRAILQWNLETGEQKLIARFPVPVYSVFYDWERKMLLAGLSDGKISLIDLEKKQEIKILQQHTAPVFDIKYSPVNQVYIASSADGSISFVGALSFSCEKIVKLCPEKVRSLSLNEEESEMAVACGDGTVRFFDLSERKEYLGMDAHKESANAVIFHPDGKHLLSGGKDAHLFVWERKGEKNWEIVSRIPAHNYAVYSIVFHPGKKLFATASRDKTIKIWDAENFDFLLRISKENQEGHAHSVNSIYWSHFNNLLVSAGDDKEVMGWLVE